MPPAQIGNTYLNFLSTHDGIGMRPLEGIVPDKELKKFFKILQKSGAFLSFRSSNNKENVLMERIIIKLEGLYYLMKYYFAWRVFQQFICKI